MPVNSVVCSASTSSCSSFPSWWLIPFSCSSSSSLLSSCTFMFLVFGFDWIEWKDFEDVISDVNWRWVGRRRRCAVCDCCPVSSASPISAVFSLSWFFVPSISLFLPCIPVGSDGVVCSGLVLGCCCPVASVFLVRCRSMFAVARCGCLRWP